MKCDENRGLLSLVKCNLAPHVFRTMEVHRCLPGFAMDRHAPDSSFTVAGSHVKLCSLVSTHWSVLGFQVSLRLKLPVVAWSG